MDSCLSVVAGWGKGALTLLSELSLCKAPMASEKALRLKSRESWLKERA